MRLLELSRLCDQARGQGWSARELQDEPLLIIEFIFNDADDERHYVLSRWFEDGPLVTFVGGEHNGLSVLNLASLRNLLENP